MATSTSSFPKTAAPHHTFGSNQSSSSGYATPSTTLAEERSYAQLPKPFKSALWASRTSNRRNKNLKQVLTLEKERVDKVVKERSERWISEEGNITEGEGDAEEGLRKSRGWIMDVHSYMSVDAAPSVLPLKKYCDITGLEAKYVDPASTLRYHNPEVYTVIKSFQPGVIQSYLSVRGQGVVLR